MNNINNIRLQQSVELKEICNKNNVDFLSLERLLDAERNKKLQKRNHFIQQVIDSEIDKHDQL